MKKTTQLAIAIGGMALLFSCDSSTNPFAYQTDTHSRGNTEIFVEESYEPLFSTTIYTFESQFPKAHIKPTYCKEQKVIETFFANKTKTIFMTRDFTKEEKAKLKAVQVEVRSELVAKDAVALILNPSNVDTNLTVVQIKEMLKGKITQWPTSKNKIDIVFDNPNSANFRYMKELIGDEALGAKVFAVKSNKEVIEYVKKHPNALGVIGVNWISDQDDKEVLDFRKGISVVGLAGEGNDHYYYKPYQAYIHTKEYPFTRELWSINKASRAGLNTGFVNFLTGEKGQLIIQKSSLVPATAHIRMIEIKTE